MSLTQPDSSREIPHKPEYDDAVAEAAQLGAEIGADYPGLWEPDEVVAANLRALVETQVKALAPKPAVQKGLHLLNAFLFVVGFVILIYAAGNGSSNEYSPNYGRDMSGWWVAYWIVTALWIGGLWLTMSRWSKRGQAHTGLVIRIQPAMLDAAIGAFSERKVDALNYTADDAATEFTPGGPMPAPQPYGVSHQGAEQLTAGWMRFFGEADAVVTQFTGDGGIDAQSQHYIAQTKNYAGTVGVESVRELAGVVAADGRKGLFFTSGTYAAGAIQFADRVGILLFRYDAAAGSLEAANAAAEAVFVRGL
ncbi:restriction endonuclease [Leifsonia sp. Leaf264]|uniref:restriction endonuclease n=1 Tax=Leifsonia sp. Leaf264 TaxID=1736314 RepID=UPI00138EFB22|nr:restriction endonuclease [Leifsonia sp. Leaf264]